MHSSNCKVSFQLENGYTFHDYNIKLNDVIQLMVKVQPDEEPKKDKSDSKKNEEKVDSKKDEDKIDYKGKINFLLVKLPYCINQKIH